MSEAVRLAGLGAPASRPSHGNASKAGSGFHDTLASLDDGRDPAKEAAGPIGAAEGEAGKGEPSRSAQFARLFAFTQGTDASLARNAVVDLKWSTTAKSAAGDEAGGTQDGKDLDDGADADGSEDAAALAAAALMLLKDAPKNNSAGESAGNAGAAAKGNIAANAPQGDGKGTDSAEAGKTAPSAILAAGMKAVAPVSAGSGVGAQADAQDSAGGDEAPLKVMIESSDRDAPEAEAASKTENPLAKLKVMGSQSAPAPLAGHGLTDSALAQSIHDGLTGAAAPIQPSAAAGDVIPRPGPVHTLQIQLTPESLGTVTAKLHLSGEQLHVEIKVDNSDAHHRLNADADSIVKSLRSLGYDVDRVTIQGPSASAQTASGQDAGNSGRNQSFQQQAAGSGAQGQGGGSGNAGNGRGGQSSGTHAHAFERSDNAASAGSGLFI